MAMATNRLTGSRKICALLLDITGVLYESGEGGGTVIPGSPEAVARLRQAGFKLRFCSNETRDTKKALVDKLTRLGYEIQEEEIHSPVPACRQYLADNKLRPYLIVHPGVLPDFEGVDTTSPNAVVLADAYDSFTYETLNKAFRLLISQPGTPLISLGQGRYYKEGDALTLDVGPFTKALEYAAGVEAQVIGKPSGAFFLSAVKQLGASPQNVIMIGDDILNDVGGAQRCGLFGVLVKTGKYRPEDEVHPTVQPDGTVNNLAEAIDLLLTS